MTSEYLQEQGGTRGRTRKGRGASRNGDEKEVGDEEERPDFPNYALPARLVVLESLVFIFLVMLLLASPAADSVAAISRSGSTGIGLLRTCNGADCGGWLGGNKSGGSGGGSTSSSSSGSGSDDGIISNIVSRHFHKRQSNPSSSSTGSSSAATSQTDPTTFHLTKGLAAICLFYMVGFSLFFHIGRWWYPTPPPLENPDPDDEEYDDLKNKSWTAKLRSPSKWYGFKRFGYRVSRVYTLIGHILLIAIAIAAIMQVVDSTIGTGAIFLVAACILHLLVTLIEFVGRRGKIGKWLYCFSDKGCFKGGARAKSSQTNPKRSQPEQIDDYRRDNRRR